MVTVTRPLIGASSGDILNPEQIVHLPHILAAYTITGAYGNFEERDSGSIKVGEWDMVLDKNLFETLAYEIHKTTVPLNRIYLVFSDFFFF